MAKENIKYNVSSELEDILLKLEYLEGTTRVCASAFENGSAFSNTNPREVSNTFYLIHSQVNDIALRVGALNDAIMANNAVICQESGTMTS